MSYIFYIFVVTQEDKTKERLIRMLFDVVFCELDGVSYLQGFCMIVKTFGCCE